jgi:type IX secretion system PorP/SprF family membrane protein
MKHYLLILSFALTILLNSVSLFGQADISMTTHWNNRANYNPASIARTEYLYLFGNARRQWMGISGSPTTINLQASEYIHSLKSAFGLSVVNDKIGLTTVMNPTVSYAYRISSNVDFDSPALSLGLSAGLFARTINGSSYDPTDSSDPAISYSDITTYKPDANIGVEYQSKYLIFGVSMTHLLSIGKSSNSSFLNTSHRYVYGIYKNTNSEYYNFSLGTELINRNNLTVVEVNTSVRFKHPTGLYEGPRELFDIGLSYRTSQLFSFLAGVNLTKNLRVGYSYEYSFKLGSNQSGTHEIMLEYRIPTQVSSICQHCQEDHDWYF